MFRVRAPHECRVEQLPVVAQLLLEADLRRVVARDRHALDRGEERDAGRVLAGLTVRRCQETLVVCAH